MSARKKAVDSSNSQPSCSERNSTGFDISPGRSGIDTISWVFRWDKTHESRHSFEKVIENFDPITKELSGPEKSGYPISFIGSSQRGYQADAELPGGIRWAINTASYSIRIEGRLAPLLTGNADNHELMGGHTVMVGVIRSARDLCQILAPEGDEWIDLIEKHFSKSTCGLRRLDIASEIKLPPFQGLLLLRGFANISCAGAQPVNIWGRQGRTETVNLNNRSRKIRARIYDKSAESPELGLVPGSLIRFERQMSWDKAKQKSMDLIDSKEIAREWQEGFVPWFGKQALVNLQTDEANLTIQPLEDAADRILKEVDEGRVTVAAGERLIGSLLISKLRGKQWWADQGSRDAGYRRGRELKSLGVQTGAVEQTTDLGTALNVAAAALRSPNLQVIPPRELPSHMFSPWDVVEDEAPRWDPRQQSA